MRRPNRIPPAEHVENLRRLFRGSGIVATRETTPAEGGVRRRDVQKLVDEGCEVVRRSDLP